MPRSYTFILEERSFAAPDDAKDFALRAFHLRRSIQRTTRPARGDNVTESLYVLGGTILGTILTLIVSWFFKLLQDRWSHKRLYDHRFRLEKEYECGTSSLNFVAQSTNLSRG